MTIYVRCVTCLLWSALCLLFAVPTLAAEVAPPPSTDPAGCWAGTWCSSTNGHHGPIQMRLCLLEGGCYRAHFRGRYMGIVPFQYCVQLSVTGQTPDGKTLLSGQSNLPLFGNFCCSAEASDCQFTASYTSSKDQGQFSMTRK